MSKHVVTVSRLADPSLTYVNLGEKPAAVHVQRLAGDVASAGAGDKAHRRGDFLRRTAAIDDLERALRAAARA